MSIGNMAVSGLPFAFFLSDTQHPISKHSAIWNDPLPLSRKNQKTNDGAFIRYGDYFRAAQTMDGHFVPNITMGPFLVQTYKRAARLPLDVHLMIEQPERYLEAYAKAGAACLTVHVETCPDLSSTLKQIKSLGCWAGLVLNPATPVGAIEPFLGEADLVLVMSVNPGFSGGKFVPESFARVAEVRQRLDAIASSAWLEVDGGVNAENLPKLKAAGATAFVAATAVFKYPQGIAAGIQVSEVDNENQRGHRDVPSSPTYSVPPRIRC